MLLRFSIAELNPWSAALKLKRRLSPKIRLELSHNEVHVDAQDVGCTVYHWIESPTPDHPDLSAPAAHNPAITTIFYHNAALKFSARHGSILIGFSREAHATIPFNNVEHVYGIGSFCKAPTLSAATTAVTAYQTAGVWPVGRSFGVT